MRSIHALILYRGNTVRSKIARPETVLQFLSGITDLEGYQVLYWHKQQYHRVTGEGFQALFGDPTTFQAPPPC